MATWQEWMNGVWEQLGGRVALHDAVALAQQLATPKVRDTAATYEQLRAMGLPTVAWRSFTLSNDDELGNKIEQIDQFITIHAPCLFIWDSVIATAQKGYLFDVHDIGVVVQWIMKNGAHLQDYNYLITSKINPHSTCFVGNVFTDGKGNMICETLHDTVNHRDIAQPPTDTTTAKKVATNLDIFTLIDYELFTQRRGLLPARCIHMIRDLFAYHTGYFELVYGEHNGRLSMAAVGYEPLRFPHEWHAAFQHDLTGRILAAQARG